MIRLLIVFVTSMLWLETSSAQPIGEIDTAGTTWYDLQAIGSVGRLIGVDNEGYVQVVWLNGLNDAQNPRHVYWNVWDPTDQRFALPYGTQVSVSTRTGLPSLWLDDAGRAYLAFHASTSGGDVNISMCRDEFPYEGAFLCTGQIPSIPPFGLLYPKMTGSGNVVHAIYTHPEALDFPSGIFYSRGEISEAEISFEQSVYLDRTLVYAHDVASSNNSGRVALGWTRPTPINEPDNLHMLDNDVVLKLSEDTGATWSENINITQFVPGDTVHGNRDTLRADTDLSLLFDREDALHAAFTTRSWYTFCPNGTPEPCSWINLSMLWHWNEHTGQFSLVADGWWPFTDPLMGDGAWQLNVCKPSLAIDTTNVNLYCAYVKYDTNCTSEEYMPMADIWISVSTNNGANWSVGTNVTRTCPGELVPPPGSMSEREPSLAEFVTEDMLHLLYCLDHDAGSAIYGEGTLTLNEIMYQRIPVDSIPTTPLMPQYPLHWDSSGFFAADDEHPRPVAREFKLHPPFPNPFNSQTTIEYDLSSRMNIRIAIYDLLGREVAVLTNGIEDVGLHESYWNADRFTSGIYFVSLQIDARTLTQKLLLIR